MLIYVRISEALKQRLDGLIAGGHYSNLNAVVTTALENLLLAEEDTEKSVPIPIPPAAKPPQSAPQVASAKSSEMSQPVDRDTVPKSWSWQKPVQLPDKYIAPMPADLFRHGQRVPVERWVFGQQNRILPAKVNSRFLVMLIADRNAEVELFEAARRISEQSADVHSFLNQLDQRFDHGKDDLLSTGFPEPGSDKASSRYANHFAAYENTQGNLTGMLIQWKLAGVKRVKNKTFILPTKACMDFAALSNPLFDQPVLERPSAKFSAAEIAWAINHIAANVPVESSAFTTILTGLTRGCITPDALDLYVREHAKEKGDVTEAFVSTQRSGAVSRMADLGLVRRQREGTKVSYELTELGRKWLNDHAPDRLQ